MGGKESPGAQPSSCKAFSAFSPGWSPSDGRRPATPSFPRQEPVAEPDQLVRTLRTGKRGPGTPPSGPWARKASLAGDSERGLGVTWPTPQVGSHEACCSGWPGDAGEDAGGQGSTDGGRDGEWKQKEKRVRK